MKEFIKYTGNEPSFTTIDLWQNDRFLTAIRSYTFAFEIEDEELFGEKCFRVSAYYNGNTYLFGITCNEINITDYICNEAGEIISKKERVLKVE